MELYNIKQEVDNSNFRITVDTTEDFELIKQLIEKFNQQVGNQGWGNARAHYLEGIRKELLKRNFKSDNIITRHKMSLTKKIKLENNQLVIIE